MSRRLNPMMEEAMRLLAVGPLEQMPYGWVPTVGAIDYLGEPFNSHTIAWLKSNGYVRVERGRAYLRDAGRIELSF